MFLTGLLGAGGAPLLLLHPLGEHLPLEIALKGHTLAPVDLVERLLAPFERDFLTLMPPLQSLIFELVPLPRIEPGALGGVTENGLQPRRAGHKVSHLCAHAEQHTLRFRPLRRMKGQALFLLAQKQGLLGLRHGQPACGLRAFHGSLFLGDGVRLLILTISIMPAPVIITLIAIMLPVLPLTDALLFGALPRFHLFISAGPARPG